MPTTDTTNTDRIKLVIADGDPLALRVLTDTVRAEGPFVVAAQATDRTEAIELARHYKPDVLLADASLLAQDDFAIARQARADNPTLAIVALTKDAHEHDPIDALRVGVSAILGKGTEPTALRDALCAVADGHAVVEPQVTMELIERLRHAPTAGRGFRPIQSKLTNREWEILDQLVREASTKDIAAELYLTEDTVYSHIKSILRKLGVHTRAEAVEAAQQLYELPVAA